VDDSVISEENALTLKGLREAFSKIDEAVDYFQNQNPVYDCSAKVELELQDVLSCEKEFYKQICQLEPKHL
jgi:hypothetical protein